MRRIASTKVGTSPIGRSWPIPGTITSSVGGGSATVRFNTTGLAVDEIIVVDDRALRIVFGSADDVLEVAASGLIEIGPISIEGEVSWSTVGGKQVFAGRDLTIFFGDGPFSFEDGERNPLARGLVITDAVIGIVEDGGLHAIDVRGTVALVGVDEDDRVFVTMGGGCQGCAASAATLRDGIRRSIQEAIPEVTDVVDATDHEAGENPFYT